MDIEEQYDKIYRYCYFKLYDKQLAQDITQESFLRFYKQELSLDDSKELPYLYTIAKNLCIDVFRKNHTGNLEDIDRETVYDPAEAWIERLTLQASISKLPQDEQELLLLRYANDVSISFICKITGLSRFAVYRKLSKSLKWLKEELKKEGFSE
ncbi:MAG: sigma-70 family RNA polymerase sigma factor [Eubacterium sp.]|nr:sigma-70 family RNA polymerase sigma factor [Eubacterium sp.]